MFEEGRTLLLVNPQHIKVKSEKERNFRDVKRLAAGLERDQEEILFGLTLVHSNKQVEGQVNKLKLMKRMEMGEPAFPSYVNVSFTLSRVFSLFNMKGKSKRTLFHPTCV